MIHSFWIIGLKFLKILFAQSQIYDKSNKKVFWRFSFPWEYPSNLFWNLFLKFLENSMRLENENSIFHFQKIFENFVISFFSGIKSEMSQLWELTIFCCEFWVLRDYSKPDMVRLWNNRKCLKAISVFWNKHKDVKPRQNR